MKQKTIWNKTTWLLLAFAVSLAVFATASSATSLSKALAVQVNNVLKEQTDSDDSNWRRMKKLYTYVIEEYEDVSAGNFNAEEGWEKQYAAQMLQKKKGDCYHFAAAYAFLVKRATNYPVRIGLGTTNAFHTGMLEEHAWVEVKLHSEWQVCDPNLDQFAEDLTGTHFLQERSTQKAVYNNFKNAEYVTVTLDAEWIKEKGKKYYVLPSGKPATGSYQIDGIYYIFGLDGELQQPSKTSLVTIGKQTYSVSPTGKAISGWQILKNKLYHAKKTGAVRKNTTYQGISFGKTGAAKNNDACKQKLAAMKAVSAVTTDKMTKSQKLRACWNYLVSRRNFRYLPKYPNLNKKGWAKATAYNMLTTHSGNCYSFACAFAAMAKEIGYKPSVVCGRVSGSRDRARDGLTRHSWVKINGCHYDPEAQFARWHGGIYGYRYYPVRHTVQKVVAY